ncbi:acetyl-CoA carboxylase biotin carboxylase subunit [Flavobacteriales bacterium]|nr:acetyl-CoA carboxylase biotin carboxylase subunit [Flavobacteriales bacterium]
MNKILIANRGEIALRIMRTCEKMGIKSVAIYSEADAKAPFVKYADEAVCVGPSPSSQSYLVQEKIIEVALERDVDGIHPGYGFLSENAEFAQKVTKAGIVFIGPSPESMRVMGDKLAAKTAVKDYDIPMVPGVDHAIENVESALETAKEIGFPILIKAAAGGGGKGMRVVNSEEEFVSQMERAVSEAVSAFGNGAVFIEKYIGSPRHIEIQLLADQHGNVVHLFERECSVQRRHQKVIEEAPSSVLSEDLRNEMGEAACKVAQSCNYIGAGTVEFLYDNGLFYFLEMNTRLQVEHPVTEMITGVDLVQEQINIARGQKLSFSQKDLKIKGHSLEVRVYAENPENDFLPDVGNLLVYKRPVGDGVRVDDGLEQGMDIPIFYDPMIAKLIVYGEDRQQAIARMTKAIQDYDIVGVETTLGFCEFAINHEAFVSGDFDTHFVDLHFKNPEKLLSSSKAYVEAGVVASYLFATKSFSEKNYLPSDYSSWRQKR